ncbi:GAF domain-containing protein [Aestuariibacter sp. AA17]|uniref:GAF domain-containing protein n=1 Tax=Fluctibacter corallii TaxID=2984329 RepID=A0ABT3A5J3_9ALTE|nr:GAF domain-containing protein [Aestuariibacter sp. AA17]MCV2883888.1 GAF domain-containing protein [Aestuariibacter sp. AA17]
MKTPPIPKNETARLQALYRLHILDTPQEQRFDKITEQAQRFFQVPVAVISFIDEHRQWFKSKIGIDNTETPRDIAFCAHTIVHDDVLYVPDAQLHEAFKRNPQVIEPPHIRTYMGAPITAPTGEKIGSLCVVDMIPRVFVDSDKEVLMELARIVEAELHSDES